MQIMKSLQYLVILYICISGRSYSNPNIYEHPSFGLSITKPSSWEFLNPNEIGARISDTKLEDEDIQTLVQSQMEPPLVEITKDSGQPIPPKLSITVNELERDDYHSPVDIIKRVSRNAPHVFKDYSIVRAPMEIQIAGQKGAYMKAHYTGQFLFEDQKYPLQYETWILPANIPEKRYFFMIGVIALQDLNSQDRDEIASIINSLKFESDASDFKDEMFSILESHFHEATQNQYGIDDCLQLTKPYGIWDIRPRGIGHLDIGGELARPKDVSWVQLGMLTAHLKLAREESIHSYEKWIQNIAEINPTLKNINSQSKSNLITLVEMVKKSDHRIFISHEKFKRADELFCQEGEFWKYDIPENSYFEISDKKLYLHDASYSDQDQVIFNQIDELGYYGIVKHHNSIIIIIDGLLCSCYGYIFAPSEFDLMSLGPLYDIQDLQKINSNPDCYFYFSR